LSWAALVAAHPEGNSTKSRTWCIPGTQPTQGEGSSASEPTVVSFEQSPLSRRFRARGGCVGGKHFDRTKRVCGSSGGGGWGNKMRRAIQVMGKAMKEQGVPVVSGFSGDLHLPKWFEKMRPAPGRRLRHTSESKGCHHRRLSPLRSLKEDLGVHSCAMRQYMDRPTAELARRLSVTTGDLVPGDVVIALHLRFGDKLQDEVMHRGGTRRLRNGKDSRIGDSMLDEAFALVDKLISDIESQDPKLRVRIFVASDIPMGVTSVKEKWGARVLPLRQKIAFHSNHEKDFHGSLSQAEHCSLISDLVSDWYFLALADILIQPMGSSFSESAMYLGMQGTCLFSSGAWSRRDHKRAPCVSNVAKSMR